MGLFDKLFAKKYCDVCGKEMAMFGNEKIADGIVCKDCHTQLSPFFRAYRSTTAEGIKEQLAYREANKELVAAFEATTSVRCEYSTLYFDEEKKQFICTGASNWRNQNPDVIAFSQVIGVETEVEEDREEIMRQDSEGNEVSCDPPRYEKTYEFHVNIQINSPWFSELELQVNDDVIRGTASMQYREAQNKCRQIERIFRQAREQEQTRREEASAPKVPVQCPACGANGVPDANGCCEYCGTHLA